MASGNSVEEIEAMINGGVDHRLTQIGIIKALSNTPIRLSIGQAQMPFTNHPGLISGQLQHFRQGGAFFFYEGIAMISIQHPVFQSRPPTIAARD